MVEPPARRDVDAAPREVDRTVRVRGDRVTVHDPARPSALAGPVAGVVTTVALAVVVAQAAAVVLGPDD